MGKNLVITGANFENNALERAANWTEITSLFYSWESGGYIEDGTKTTSGVFKRSTDKVDISIYAGKRIKFLNCAWTTGQGQISGFYTAIVFDASNNVIQSVAFPKNGANSTGYALEAILTLDASAYKIVFTYFTDAKAEALQQPSFYCYVYE